MSGRGMTVLHVEDDPAHALFLRRTLGTLGMDIDLVQLADGEAALDYLYRRNAYRAPASSPRPGLILLDLKLPRVDGHEVLRCVKNEQTLRRIPVVVLSTSESDEDVRRAYDFRANGYLVKPVDFRAFVGLVKSVAGFWMTWNRPSTVLPAEPVPGPPATSSPCLEP